MSGRVMHKLVTNPRLMAKALATGRLPRESRVTSPLIELLERISAHDRTRMRGVHVEPKLGYARSGRFDNAEQLLRWLKPNPTMVEGESWPAESMRMKGFAGPVRLADLLAVCDVYPDGIESRVRGV